VSDPTANLPPELAEAMAPDEDNEKVSQATALVRLAEGRYRFAQADDGRKFVVPLEGPNLALPLRGHASLRSELASAYFNNHAKAPSSSAVADALCVIEGRAGAADREPVALRVAGNGENSIVVDLGTSDGRSVLVAPSGWEVVDRSPVLFRRTELTGPLPTPVRGGSLDELRDLLNVSKSAWEVLVGVLVTWLLPEVPRPVVLLVGEQGTAKTTTARFLSAVIDPSPVQVRGSPRDLEDWVVAASGSWVVVLDNLSSIPEWMSDAICRACTGEGMARRALYTDDDIAVTSFRRAVMLTAIDAGSLRGDLGDRLVMVELDRINPTCRLRDKAMAKAFVSAHPAIFGALLDLMTLVLKELPSVDPVELPRMADFATVLVALDRVTGSRSFDSYVNMGTTIAADVVAGDAVADAVAMFVRRERSWTGKPTELLKAVTPDPPPKGWPRQANVLTRSLRRAAPALQKVGVIVDFDPRTSVGRRITLSTTAPEEAKQPSSSSRSSLDGIDQGRHNGSTDDDFACAATTDTPIVIDPRATKQDEDLRRDGHDGHDGQSHRPSELRRGADPRELAKLLDYDDIVNGSDQ
jgi:hypothetical protein